MNPLPTLTDKFRGYQNRYGQFLELFIAFKKCLAKEDISKFELKHFMIEQPNPLEPHDPIAITAYGRQYQIALGMRVTAGSCKGVLIFSRVVNDEANEVATVTFNGQGVFDFTVNDDELEMKNWHHALTIVLTLIDKELNSTPV
ncbi:hypothetical protein J3L11_18310 [Shewanella sp. 4t3-1-2LB]|uniref:hypothetical protein n=1 Tax=Shewanella sp. 4t3-1-2LB TaxID=2817682 RepID=UPI001A990B7D|nr:hypothetical protein [Shewanella sp. 4t3-1-2LB]MBO1273589.1 hypothetical protein [Shewanella sp. 4t3-1-2LB]